MEIWMKTKPNQTKALCYILSGKWKLIAVLVLAIKAMAITFDVAVCASTNDSFLHIYAFLSFVLANFCN